MFYQPITINKYIQEVLVWVAMSEKGAQMPG